MAGKTREQRLADRKRLVQEGLAQLTQELQQRYDKYTVFSADLHESRAEKLRAEKEIEEATKNIEALAALGEEAAELVVLSEEIRGIAQDMHGKAKKDTKDLEERVQRLNLTKAKIEWLKSQDTPQSVAKRKQSAKAELGTLYGQFYSIVGKLNAGEEVTTDRGVYVNQLMTDKPHLNDRVIAAQAAVVEAIDRHDLPGDRATKDELWSALWAKVDAYRETERGRGEQQEEVKQQPRRKNRPPKRTGNSAGVTMGEASGLQ